MQGYSSCCIAFPDTIPQCPRSVSKFLLCSLPLLPSPVCSSLTLEFFYIGVLVETSSLPTPAGLLMSLFFSLNTEMTCSCAWLKPQRYHPCWRQWYSKRAAFPRLCTERGKEQDVLSCRTLIHCGHTFASVEWHWASCNLSSHLRH